LLSLEQQVLGQPDTQGNESIQESNEGDDCDVNELAAGHHCAGLLDSAFDADTWVKAAEFVPGQLWQSVGK